MVCVCVYIYIKSSIVDANFLFKDSKVTEIIYVLSVFNQILYSCVISHKNGKKKKKIKKEPKIHHVPSANTFFMLFLAY